MIKIWSRWTGCVILVLGWLPRELAHLGVAMYPAYAAPEEWHGGRLWLDSGGYRLMRRDDIRIAEVLRVYSSVKAEVKFSLDVPPTPYEGKEDIARKAALTRLFYAALSSHVDVVPVVHYHPRVSAVDVALKYYEDAKMIGLGGAVPYVFCRRNVHCDPKPVVETVERLASLGYCVHVFGLGAPSILQRLKEVGACSTDSTGWRHKARYGLLYSQSWGEVHYAHVDDQWRQWAASIGCRPDCDLSTFKCRLQVNACLLTQYAKKLKV